MELKQTNRVRMFTAVIAVLEQFQSVWSTMAPFAPAFQRFKDKVQAVNDAAQKQGTATAGASLDRENARDALEDVLFLICQALKVLAHQANDNELRTLTDVSSSSLHVMNDVELENLANTIKAQTVPRAAELATLQVSAGNLAELATAIDDFHEVKSAPRAATANRVGPKAREFCCGTSSRRCNDATPAACPVANTSGSTVGAGTRARRASNATTS